MTKRIAVPAGLETVPTADVIPARMPPPPVQPDAVEFNIVHYRPKKRGKLLGYRSSMDGKEVPVYEDDEWEVISPEEYERLQRRAELVVPPGESYSTPTIDHERITSAVATVAKVQTEMNEFTTELRQSRQRLRDLEVDLENTHFDSQDELSSARDAERDLVDRIDYLERYGIPAVKKAFKTATTELATVKAEIFDPVWDDLAEQSNGLEAESILWLVNAILNRREAYVAARTAEQMSNDFGITGRSLGNGTRTALELVEKAWVTPTLSNFNQMIATLNARFNLTLDLVTEGEDDEN